ncbi:hypothetical protein B0T26DRAFT_679166 [Lasiosphaeria miniovina]|uniref:Alcohol dehydrogenase n=1 Tax=Lasiosphaeria miniovina TaxID=1954250 RepID=A0AA40A608_9PEZI|nr:uncharacterized protein B0T26DRAFT_679166 [Lasiosphaeria miniovina]KAK0709798.1 hypothetical protein B0T26DRAFT_679166 [Lasiosphaeria miniovina]
MGYPETFDGFCPKPFESHDVDVQIECCGVCGFDIHTVTGGWGEFKGPLCVGHEIIGKAVRVGKDVKNIKEGDIETYALTHSPHKVEDAKKLGAKEVIVTSDDKKWAEPLAFKFDFVLNCSDMTNKFGLPTYLSILKVGGQFHMVGLPDKPLPEVPDMDAMLKLAADKGVRPQVESIDISEKACKEVVERVRDSKVHYRFTLTRFNKAFGTK